MKLTWKKVKAEVLLDEYGWVRGVVVPDGQEHNKKKKYSTFCTVGPLGMLSDSEITDTTSYLGSLNTDKFNLKKRVSEEFKK